MPPWRQHTPSRRIALGLCLSLGLVFGPVVAFAQTTTAVPASEADAVRAFDAALQEGLVPLSVALGGVVSQLFPEQRTAGICLRGPLGPGRQEPLARSLEGVLTARGLRPVPITPALCEQRTDAATLRTAGVSFVLDLAWTLGQGDVTVAAQVLMADEGPWARFFRAPIASTRALQEVAVTLPNPLARAGFGMTQAPAWPQVPLARPVPRTVVTPFRDVVALAAGDLDGTPGDELVVVTPTTAYVARFEQGALRFLSAAGTSLGPAGWAPVPGREPFGSAAYAPDERTVRLRTSALAETATLRLVDNAVVVRPQPAPDARWPVPSDDGRACAVLRGDRVVRWWRRCGEGPEAPLPGDEAFRAALPVVRGSRVAWCDGAGRCALWEGTTLRGTLPEAASPVEIIDLHNTGTQSLIAASSAPPGSADRVRSLVPVGDAMQPLATVATPGPVTALTTADLAGNGQRAVIAAVIDPVRHTTTLWVWP